MNNISVQFNDHFAVMNFLNCSIKVPMRYGGEVIASGCGSGKTTIIKEIIRQKFNEGILYSAATIEECNRMYDWIINNLIGTSINGVELTINDVIVLHCENSEGNDLFMNRPEDIGDKLIVICTHYKLTHEYPEILFKKNFDQRIHMVPETGLRRSVTRTMQYGSKYGLPRQFVLIDELPTCDIVKARIEKPLMGILMDTVDNSEWSINEFGQRYISKLDMKYKKFDDFSKMEYSYNTRAKGTSLSITKGDSEIDKFRTKLPLEVLYERFHEYNPNSEIIDTEVKYNFTDLILSGMETRFWLFDGTGDLTFENSLRFNVRTVRNKYNSPIEYIKIKNSIGRYHRESSLINNQNEIKRLLDENITRMINIINENDKVLFLVWKNFKLKSSVKRTDSINISETIFNNDFLLADYYSHKICENLGVQYTGNKRIKYNNKEFSIIHYQSGLDKATNEFMDYDSIVLFGNFLVPEDAVVNFNKMYDCSTSYLKFTTYQLTQSICRTRIRKHKGENIRIYYTNDWDDNYIMYLNMYLTNSVNWMDINKINDTGILSISDKIKLSDDVLIDNIQNKWRKDIKSLIEYDDNVRIALLNKSKYSLTIELKVMNIISPRKDLRVREYYPLINYLRKLGIDLTVISERIK